MKTKDIEKFLFYLGFILGSAETNKDHLIKELSLKETDLDTFIKQGRLLVKQVKLKKH